MVADKRRWRSGLAEEGVDINNTDELDADSLQRALNQAVARHNLALFTPVWMPERSPRSPYG